MERRYYKVLGGGLLYRPAAVERGPNQLGLNSTTAAAEVWRISRAQLPSVRIVIQVAKGARALGIVKLGCDRLRGLSPPSNGDNDLPRQLPEAEERG